MCKMHIKKALKITPYAYSNAKQLIFFYQLEIVIDAILHRTKENGQIKKLE